MVSGWNVGGSGFCMALLWPKLIHPCFTEFMIYDNRDSGDDWGGNDGGVGEGDCFKCRRESIFFFFFFVKLAIALADAIEHLVSTHKVNEQQCIPSALHYVTL